MGDILRAVLTIGLGIGGFVGGLLLIYAATNLLPTKLRGGGQLVVFVGPVLLLLFVGLFLPAIQSTILSFTRDPQLPPGNSGLFANFGFIFGDKNLRQSVFNSLVWVIGGGTISTIFGLMIARFADGMKRESIVKSMIFIPVALSLAGAGIIWKFVYDGPPFNYGLLNAITKIIPGLPDSVGGDGQRSWIIESGLGMNTLLLVIVLIWVQTGFALIVLSAAIKGVPESLAEAAKVDGATDRQIFYRITVPYIRPALLTVITTGTIASLKAFDIVQAMTSTIANEYYTNFSVQNRDNVAATLGVILFLMVIPVVVLNSRGQKRASEMAG
jgi:alpha-glucoside transport system permease protein